MINIYFGDTTGLQPGLVKISVIISGLTTEDVNESYIKFTFDPNVLTYSSYNNNSAVIGGGFTVNNWGADWFDIWNCCIPHYYTLGGDSFWITKVSFMYSGGATQLTFSGSTEVWDNPVEAPCTKTTTKPLTTTDACINCDCTGYVLFDCDTGLPYFNGTGKVIMK